jgi:Cytochrome oxidase maturation protein cbb3-type
MSGQYDDLDGAAIRILADDEYRERAPIASVSPPGHPPPRDRWRSRTPAPCTFGSAVTQSIEIGQINRIKIGFDCMSEFGLPGAVMAQPCATLLGQQQPRTPSLADRMPELPLDLCGDVSGVRLVPSPAGSSPVEASYASTRPSSVSRGHKRGAGIGLSGFEAEFMRPRAELDVARNAPLLAASRISSRRDHHRSCISSRLKLGNAFPQDRPFAITSIAR